MSSAIRRGGWMAGAVLAITCAVSMTQPRHTKLGLVGHADNWPLAGYTLKELKQGFAVVAKAVPRWKGLPVPDLDAAVSQPLTLLDLRGC
jgi:hypothetical protein